MNPDLRLSRILTLGVCCAFLAPALHADKVKVEVDGVRRELKQNILSALSLERENDGKLSEERIRKLYSQAPDEIGVALQPYGYYKPQVRPTLRQDGKTWTARFDVDSGPPIKIATVDLQITGAGAEEQAFRQLQSGFPLRPGEVLHHPDYERGKKSLTDLAAEEGYLDAAYQANQVRVDLERYRADVVLHFNTGPQYLFGPVYFHQDVLDGRLLAGYIDFKPGDKLDVNKVLKLQNALSDSPYWSRVEVVTRQDQAENLEVPIDVNLVPSKTVRFTGGVGYGTDTGPRVKGAFELRRPRNQEGHRAVSSASASQIEQSFQSSYIIPGAFPRSDNLSFNRAYDRQITNTLESKTGLVGTQYTFLQHGWNETYSLNYQRENYKVGLDSGTSNLLVPSAGLERRAGRRPDLHHQRLPPPLHAPGRRPQRPLGRHFPPGARGRQGDPHRGREQPADRPHPDRLHRDQRLPRAAAAPTGFFAGGDQSVRGYRYESLGTKDSEAGNVIGGEALVLASLEYEHRFLPKWSAAVFYDTGNAFHDFKTGGLAQGAGIGIRWRSPIGPVRADVACGFSDPRHPIVFHLNIGPDL